MVPHVYHQQPSQYCLTTDLTLPSHIKPAVLNNLNQGLTNYIALGSFGIVKLQVYHGIYVAVTQFIPWTFSNDIIAEAKCHLLHLLGICTKELPYCIVMQFEEIQNSSQLQPLTLHQELQKSGILDDMDWISVCAQSSEAVGICI